MTTEADEAAFAHWYEAAQTAQREVARLTGARDEALRDRDAERIAKTHRFGLRRELEEALGVGDSYADGALEAALVRIKAMGEAEDECSRLRRDVEIEREAHAESRVALQRSLSSGVLPCESCDDHWAIHHAIRDALKLSNGDEDNAREATVAGAERIRQQLDGAHSDVTRLRRELDEALAGREREYARAEAEHDAAARIASEWAASSEWVTVCDPCHRCWGPTLAGSLVCGECADDDVRQMPGGAT
jgi:hypothetical protein